MRENYANTQLKRWKSVHCVCVYIYVCVAYQNAEKNCGFRVLFSFGFILSLISFSRLTSLFLFTCDKLPHLVPFLSISLSLLFAAATVTTTNNNDQEKEKNPTTKYMYYIKLWQLPCVEHIWVASICYLFSIFRATTKALRVCTLQTNIHYIHFGQI